MAAEATNTSLRHARHFFAPAGRRDPAYPRAMRQPTTAERLRAIRDRLGIENAADLARAIGVEPATYRQWENPKRAKSRPSLDLDLVEQLAALAVNRGLDVAPVYALAGYDVRGPVGPRGLADYGAVRYLPPERSPLQAAIAAWQAAGQNREPWVMRDAGLFLAGVLPGDVAIVDLGRPPPAGAIVLASIDGAHGWHRSVLRLYRPPYLVAQTADASLLTPVLIDEATVIVRGPVIAVLRELG